jgi:trehalose 6-phosphate synthase/phosphatase
LLKGVLGADLIGFHTYDYERHFLSSVKRLLRYEVNFNKINLGIREVVVNTYPMGIDYDKFNKAAIDHYSRKASQQTELKKQIELHKKSVKDGKLILSIDRLDYTKGVLNRVKAFEQFLNKFPDYLEKVRLVMLTVPSRSEEPQYKKLKKETDEIVGRVNGEYATVNWTPIWYYYRSMDFDELIDLYSSADIAMITPIRDGMNLVAKEFVSTRINGDGVLILSELAGASKELFQALTVNPFDINSMSNTIHDAINMGIDEQKQRNFSMQKRIKRYTVKYWADEFISSLNEISVVQENGVLKIDDKSSKIIKENYKKSSNKLILLDYDGTLVEFNEKPGRAIPDNETLKILKDLSQENDVAIVSGRDQHFLDKHFSNLKLTLVAEHGYFTRNYSESWSEKANFNKDRIKSFKPILDSFSDRTPGTFVEEKLNSIVWHYRKSDPELANSRVVEFKTVFDSLSTDELNLMDMDKAIEIINAQVNKGSAVSEIISNKDYDFILCIGDDITDENMFESLPKNSYTIKVGKKKTRAKYYIKDTRQVKTFLSFLTK